jgi:Zn-dependent peptidase ImmA (M78 family)
MGVSETALRETIAENPRPNQSIVSELSNQLSVPPFVFYMDRAPELGPGIVDFRQPHPAATPKLPATVQAIAMAERLQEVAADLQHEDSLPRNVSIGELRSAEFAGKTRLELGISTDRQIGAKDAAAFYSICRAAVEQTGVFVMQDSFPSEDGSGFCLAEGRARFIVVNTHRQNHGRRNFTLFHELGHALMGRSGVSDPFTTHNDIERSCNQFAARVLAPAALTRMAFERCGVSSRPTVDEIRNCARFLKISQQATVIRLEQLKLVGEGAHTRWLAAVRANGNPDFEIKRGGGANVAQERVKLAQYGYTFGRVFGRAVKQSAILPLDLYRMSGLKPKYQRPYFDYAAAAGSDDADD